MVIKHETSNEGQQIRNIKSVREDRTKRKKIRARNGSDRKLQNYILQWSGGDFHKHSSDCFLNEEKADADEYYSSECSSQV